MLPIAILTLSGILLLAISLSYKFETFMTEPSIIFMNPYDIQSFMSMDEDRYVEKMSPADFHAREALNANDYIEKSRKDVLAFTMNDKELLKQAIQKANRYFLSYNDEYIQSYEMNRIPWKLALTKGYYENGLPHTRMDIIFLPQSLLNQSIESITQTLIHEKVHLHQRIYKARYQKVLISKNYQIVGKRDHQHRIRTNPDVDEYIYYHPDHFIMVENYRTLTPKEIQDTEKLGLDAKYEHPYEEIAYQVAEKYKV